MYSLDKGVLEELGFKLEDKETNGNYLLYYYINKESGIAIITRSYDTKFELQVESKKRKLKWFHKDLDRLVINKECVSELIKYVSW